MNEAVPGLSAAGIDIDPTEEHEVFRTTLHPWIVFSGPIGAALFLIVLGAIIGAINHSGPLFAIGVAIAVLPPIAAYIRYRFSRFVITSRRITIQSGWLSRKSFEMLLSKVESIQVEQTFSDRFLGSGVVVIHGTGGSREAFPGIREAVKFRQVATESIEWYVSRRSK